MAIINKHKRIGLIAIAIGFLAATRGSSELLEVGRNVDVLMLFFGGMAIGTGLVSLVTARRNR